MPSVRGVLRRINAPFPSSTEYFEGIKQSRQPMLRGGVGYNRASGAGRNSALRRDFQTVSSDGTTATVGNRSLRCSRLWLPASPYLVHPWTRASPIYGPTPVCKTFDHRCERKSLLSYIRPFNESVFDFLAPMVICAHPPHHPSGFFIAHAGNRF